MLYRESPPKLRCYCECTGDVHLLATGEACPGEGRVLTGFSTEETIAIVCGRTDHEPLEDQTLCGKYAGHGEHCVKPIDHDGDCVADWQIEKAMLEDVRR